MSIFTYHFVKVSVFTSLKMILFSPKSKNIDRLETIEYMNSMTLCASILSSKRILIRQITFFAQLDKENAINEFLKSNTFGKFLEKGWYIRLLSTSPWGKIREFKINDELL